MAKQTFTTGQVLLASQLTSLQQTAMNGGAFSAKTSSYTAVAADAGTAISMTSTSATTITINSGLFAAGDTILITNLGSGACVITAGTATVNTAGSLSLSQYEAGLLHFVSASSAVFNDYVQAASNPLTTTGDMIYSSSGSTQARLGIGSTSQVLTVSGGIPAWATPAASASGLNLINKTTLSSTTSVSLNNVFSATYDNYLIQYTGSFVASDTNVNIRLRASGSDNSSGNYYYVINRTNTAGTVSTTGASAQTQWFMQVDNTQVGSFSHNIYRPFASVSTSYNGTFLQRPSDRGGYNSGFFDGTNSFDGFTLFFSNACVGTLAVYGYGI